VAGLLPPLDQLMAVIGYIVLILLVALLAFSLVMATLTVFSMRKGRFYFPHLLKPGLIVAEEFIKILWRIGKIDDKDLTSFTIRLHNQLNRERFSQVPPERRAIFLPQCLRSTECPSSLTTEGLVCQRCMRCSIGTSIDELESTGCRVFIVPGSTFVLRLVKTYRPEGVIGVGCLREVKEGLDLADRMDLVAMGVVTAKDGCIETILDWTSLMDVVNLRPGPEPAH